MENKKRILVTGGEGFLGRILMKHLSQAGHKVESYDLIKGQDLLNRKQLEKAVREKDVVFHLAAVADLNISRKDPFKNMNINVLGTINVAEACLRNNIPLYYASTCCAYGNQEEHPTTEKSLPNPTEIYACSKLAGENIVKGYAKTCGLEYNIMRLATMYGPEMRPALAVYVFLEQATNNKPITIHGDGKQTRTLTYVDDVAEGMTQLFESKIKNETFNITTEEEVSVLEVVKMVQELTNSDSKIKFISQRPGQILEEKISAQKAKEFFGWEAKCSFREGLKKTYKWFQRQKD